jgi:hypothetical protein
MAALAARENVPHLSELVAVLDVEDPAESVRLATALAARMKLPAAGDLWPDDRTLVTMETLACCAALGVLDGVAAADAAPLVSRFEAALGASAEVGVGMLDVITRECWATRHYDAFMERLCRNELACASAKFFYRNDDWRANSSSLSATVSLLRDIDPNEHRGWPAKFTQWVPKDDALWRRLELRVRQSMTLPMRDIEEDNMGLNALAWSLHLLGRASDETHRAVVLDIALTSVGSGSYPAQASTVSSPMDTLAWTQSDLGRHVEAVRIETLAARLSFGNAIFAKGLTNILRVRDASKPPPGNGDGKAGGTPPGTPDGNGPANGKPE